MASSSSSSLSNMLRQNWNTVVDQFHLMPTFSHIHSVLVLYFVTVRFSDMFFTFEDIQHLKQDLSINITFFKVRIADYSETWTLKFPITGMIADGIKFHSRA